MTNRDSYRLAELTIKQAGHKLYDSLDDNEKTVLRFGMLPHIKTVAAEDDLIASDPSLLETFDRCEIGRIMAVAAMDACNASGDGMVV